MARIFTNTGEKVKLPNDLRDEIAERFAKVAPTISDRILNNYKTGVIRANDQSMRFRFDLMRFAFSNEERNSIMKRVYYEFDANDDHLDSVLKYACRKHERLAWAAKPLILSREEAA